MAAADAARLRPVEAITDWLVQAGFTRVSNERHLRNKRLVLAEVERDLLTEVRFRYAFLTSDEINAGMQRMRVDAAQGDWIDPRPTHLLVGLKPPPAG
jgi:hypothetical protein